MERFEKLEILKALSLEQLVDALDEIDKEITRLRAELEAERAVVDYYADPENWDHVLNRHKKRLFKPDDYDYTGSEDVFDGTTRSGKRARERQAQRGKV